MIGAASQASREPRGAADSDETLMERYRAGDASAFDRLYLRHRARLFRFLHHQTGNQALAEELYQDIWMNLIRARDRYVASARFSTFLLTIAHHRVADHFRDKVVQKSVSRDAEASLLSEEAGDSGDDPAARAQLHQELARIDVALSTLSVEQREIFLLKQEFDASLDELAEMTGVSRETAKSRLRYALSHLRRMLGVHP